MVTERGREVARLIPSGANAYLYADLAERFSATVPVERLETIAERLSTRSAPAGKTDRFLAEQRAERSR